MVDITNVTLSTNSQMQENKECMIAFIKYKFKNRQK